MPGRMEFDLGFGRTGGRRDSEEPMRLLVLGDFSGSPAPERPLLAGRPTRRGRRTTCSTSCSTAC